MPGPNILAGTAYLSIDGVPYLVVEGVEWESGLTTNETVTGLDGVHGIKQKPKPGRIRSTVRDNGRLSATALSQITNSTITVRLANGKTIVGRNMWIVDDLVVRSDEATIELKFEGQTGCVTEN